MDSDERPQKAMTKPKSETPKTDALIQIIEGGHEYAPLDQLLSLARSLDLSTVGGKEKK